MTGTVAQTPALVWLRRDLRLCDHSALREATADGRPVILVYLWAPEEEGDWPPGSAVRFRLRQSLAALATDLEQQGSRLILRTGDSAQELVQLCAQTGARSIYWHRCYEPAARATEQRVRCALEAAGVQAVDCPGDLLHEPVEVMNRQGTPFRVFTAFWKHCMQLQNMALPTSQWRRPCLVAPAAWPASASLDALLPEVRWGGGIRKRWGFGEKAALKTLRRFRARLEAYPKMRDFPAEDSVSGLSPYLHFGEISPHRLYAAIAEVGTTAATAYLRQLYWREFAAYLLWHYPYTARKPLRPEFAAFPWRRAKHTLQRWQQGLTGYPLVDAGMAELWQTGWMHNRVRMIAASFLVKDLLVHWLRGAEWFWDTLIDADLANNTLGWQWVAGCGADAAPYFRVFNPVLQGARFDPQGRYVKRWLPQLASLPERWVHCPWQAPPLVLHEAGVRLGTDYPAPIIDHAEARRRALAAYRELTGHYSGKYRHRGPP